MRGASRCKLFYELGFEFLESKKMALKSVFILQIYQYSVTYIFIRRYPYSQKGPMLSEIMIKLPHFKGKHIYLKNSLFPSTVME